jgi:hypothetical protein
MADLSLVLPDAATNDKESLLSTAILGSGDDSLADWDSVKKGVCALVLAQLGTIKGGIVYFDLDSRRGF